MVNSFTMIETGASGVDLERDKSLKASMSSKPLAREHHPMDSTATCRRPRSNKTCIYG